MRVMVFAKATEDSEKGVGPSQEAFEAMEKFTEELVKAGVLIAGAGLKPSAAGKRVVYEGARRTVMDGPFAETKEVIVGFSIWEVKDMDDAVSWAKRSPNLMPGKSEVEIRPFIEESDMAELLAQNDGTRGKLGVA